MTATQRQLRRGTAAQMATFTGAVGEVVVDTTNNRLVVHDGVTAGGWPMGGVASVQRSVKVSGDLPIVANDQILNLNLSAPLAITIPAASSRAGRPMLFLDVGGTWGGANTPTFNRTGSDTFDGMTSIGGQTNYGWIEFIPMNDGVNSGYKIRGIV